MSTPTIQQCAAALSTEIRAAGLPVASVGTDEANTIYVYLTKKPAKHLPKVPTAFLGYTIKTIVTGKIGLAQK